MPQPSAAQEIVRVLLMAVLFGLILLVGEAWRVWKAPPVEWTRKFAHFTGGLGIAAFPWIFQSTWSVVALGVAFALVMRITRRKGLLPSIHGVARRSEGDLYYLVAVCVLFFAGREQPVTYLISILVLVVADTAAALLGSRYGKWHYEVEGERRSLEGSGVFFLTAFLSVHLPLLLLTNIDRAACVLIAVQLALLTACFEAISLRGNDNLIVPMATFALLTKMTPYSAEWIGAQLAAQLAILLVIGLVGWGGRLLTLSGIVAAHLFFYGAWALGGPQWVVAPAVALFACALAWRPTPAELGLETRGWQVAAVFYTGLTALLLYMMDDVFQTMLPGPNWLKHGHPFFAPYVGAVAAQLAILLHIRRPGLTGAARSFLTATVVVIPVGLVAGPGGLNPVSAFTASAICLGGLATWAIGRPLTGRRPKPLWELRLQAASVIAATAIALPLLLWSRIYG